MIKNLDQNFTVRALIVSDNAFRKSRKEFRGTELILVQPDLI